MSEDLKKEVRQKFNFWRWLVKGTSGLPGYKRYVNRWLFIHVVVGLVLAKFVPVSLEQAATAVLIPLSGIFVALAFAWAVNSQSLMQSDELQIITKCKEGKFQDYVFTYQAAILVILITLILWGLSGLKVFDEQWPTRDNQQCYYVVKFILFAFSSITIRECWHVIIGTHWMLITQQEIKRVKNREKSSG